MIGVRDILVADDDENDLALIRAALGKAVGARVSCVQDGAEALDFLYARGGFHDREAGDPAFVLLDLNMPRVNGWEVLETVKSDAALRAIPVVVFSSSARETDVRRCYELGANAYVVKPIDFGEFRLVIEATEAFWLRWNTPVPTRAGGAAAAKARRRRGRRPDKGAAP